MPARKIRLTGVKYEQHPNGSLLTVGRQIPKEGADYLVKSGVASEVEETQPEKPKGDK